MILVCQSAIYVTQVFLMSKPVVLRDASVFSDSIAKAIDGKHDGISPALLLSAGCASIRPGHPRPANIRPSVLQYFCWPAGESPGQGGSYWPGL